MLELMKITFAENDYAPDVSEQTVHLHYKKHHQGYVDKVNELIIGTKFQDMSPEEIILLTKDDKEQYVLYQSAGQVYNHNIYWTTFGLWERLDTDIKNDILATFGGKDELKNRLVDAGVKVIGSGWVWLAQNTAGEWEIVTTKDGNTVLVNDMKPLLNIDVWEHAYYLDYQNLRRKYLENFVANVIGI